MKNLLKIAGILACVAALGLNLQHAMDGYGIKSGNLHLVVLAAGSSSESGGSSGSSSSPPKIKTCREVPCTGTREATADINGCIPFFFGKKICGFSANILIKYPYDGFKENCTGGSDWEDCDACQSDCVPKQ